MIERFAAYSRVPVINGLTNQHHPCQVFADIFTHIEHRGSIEGKTVAWIGDANNMLYSWLQAAKIFDFHLNISTPKATIWIARWWRQIIIITPCLRIHPMPAPMSIWSTPMFTSMGYEQENQARLQAFDG